MQEPLDYDVLAQKEAQSQSKALISKAELENTYKLVYARAPQKATYSQTLESRASYAGTSMPSCMHGCVLV